MTCWHENSSESEALWRLYCPPRSAGLAIQTTFTRLRDALPDGEVIRFGCVNYIDFQETIRGDLQPGILQAEVIKPRSRGSRGSEQRQIKPRCRWSFGTYRP